MPKYIEKTLAAVVASFFLFVHSSEAQTSKITLNLDAKTSQPDHPTLNRNTTDAVEVAIQATGISTQTSLDLPTYYYKSAPQKAVPFTLDNNFNLKFQQCPDEKYRERDDLVIAVATQEKSSAPSITSDESISISCPFAIVEVDSPAGKTVGWTVYTEKDGALLVTVREYKKDDGKAYTFPIQIVYQNYSLSWSAGFAFFGLRDEQYRIDLPPTSQSSQQATFHRVSDGGIIYKLGAFAHYTSTIPKWSWLSLTAGLGTDVPQGNLSAMLGLSLSVRTLPVANTGYLTFGAAYAQHKVLRAQYEGVSSIPSTVTADALTELRSTITYFVSISFGFWSGEDKFKGVYSGSGKK